MSPDHPTSQREDGNNAHRHHGIIQCVLGHGIRSRKAENDRDEANPTHSDQGNGAREQTKVEWPFSGVEIPRVDESDENRDSVGDVKPDCGD